MKLLKAFLKDTRAEMAEAAITLPITLLVALAMINATLAGFTSVNAANAANYGVRVGSVVQGGSAGAAASAAHQAISIAPIGEYQVSASGGGRPGSVITVSVDWQFPNYFRGLLAFFGASADDFHGAATATFRQEGW